MRPPFTLAGLVPSFSRLVLVLGAVALACSGRSVETSPKSCVTDADCAGGQRCKVAIDRPAIGLSPCAGALLCSAEDALCPTGQVCAPSWQSLPDYPYCGADLCAPPCTEGSCPKDAACGSDGVCRLTLCDAPTAAPCPDLWRCDPPAATAASHDVLEGTTVSESSFDVERNLARGCVRKKCDEPGGYECSPAWACKPSSTTQAAGCTPEDCRDTGHCSDDTTLICLTEAAHPGTTPLDVHSCVARTCDDGHSCSLLTENFVDVGRCDYGAPNADYYGCVAIPCTDDTECFNGYVCDHSSPESDPRGCRFRRCNEGNPCPFGSRCDPTAPDRDLQSCTTTPEGAGGTGTGGSAAGGTGAAAVGGSSGGSAPHVGGAGGTGGGGPVGREPPRGQCVAR